MKNSAIIVLILFAFLKTHAQDYLISFAGTGDTTAIETIKVYNLTSGTDVTLNGGDILHLKPASGIEVLGNNTSPLQIHPNPMAENSVLRFLAPGSGDAVISIVDISGKIVSQFRLFLSRGTHEFSISGIQQGMYLLKATGENYSYSVKMISQSTSLSNPVIKYISGEKGQSLKTTTQQEIINSTVDMQYTQGDLLLYKSKSGRYSTIVTDIPTASKTITFHFAGCIDHDGHKYPTVQIGIQTWMAENLNVGTLINDTTSANNNGILEKYCYEDNESNCDVYGGLYQWNELMNYDTTPGIQGICPPG
jgi:hypothetical protein